MEPASYDFEPDERLRPPGESELWRRSKVLVGGLGWTCLAAFVLANLLNGFAPILPLGRLLMPARLMSGPFVGVGSGFPPAPAVSYIVGAIAVALMCRHPLRPTPRNAVWTYVGLGLWLFCAVLTLCLALSSLVEFQPVDPRFRR